MKPILFPPLAAAVVVAFCASVYRDANEQRQAVNGVLHHGGENLPWCGLWYEDEIDAEGMYRGSNPKDRGLLANARHKVVEVDLFNCIDADARVLPHIYRLVDLERLTFSDCFFDDPDFSGLSKLTRLKKLELDDMALEDGDVRHLRNLTNLESLSLIRNEITDEGLRQLGGLKQLKELDLRSTEVTDDGVGWLQMKLPDCKIRR